MAVPGGDPVDEHRADLATLATELSVRGYGVQLATDPARGPFLRVRNPQADIMTERIYLRDEFFIWPWDEPVARRDEAFAAADQIARVLRVLTPGSGDD